MEPKYSCRNPKEPTNATAQWSRLALLDWVNSVVGSNLKKIEELSTGIVYCQLMDKLFPGCIPLKKIKVADKDGAYFYNFKLFEVALHVVGCSKNINIHSLVNGKFKENLEYLQWFRRFYYLNAGLKEPSSFINRKDLPSTSKDQTDEIENAPAKLPSTEEGIQSEISSVRNRADELRHERNEIYDKLAKIEAICIDESAGTCDKKEISDKILAVLNAPPEDSSEDSSDD